MKLCEIAFFWTYTVRVNTPVPRPPLPPALKLYGHTQGRMVIIWGSFSDNKPSFWSLPPLRDCISLWFQWLSFIFLALYLCFFYSISQCLFLILSGSPSLYLSLSFSLCLVFINLSCYIPFKSFISNYMLSE